MPGITAAPCKLRDGSWGAKTTGRPDVGDTITITTKGGKSWDAEVTRVVWTDGAAAIVATRSLDRTPRRGRNWDPDAFAGYGRLRGGYRRACVSGGNCSSFGSGRSCGGHDCDGY